MILGIGTDLVQISRIAVALARWGEKFASKILAESELAQFRMNPNAAFLAKRFAAKEAVAKALGTGMRLGVNFPQIAVVGKPGYRPEISMTGAAAERARSMGVVSSHLSISDEQEYALAFVVLEGLGGKS
ncbi:MAG: holo-ACP synthase [SAR86 cluster bacterium]|uniref:Holo-[acyl-carrier-protein] synthase n=1 Tax=SAR86 cluster bacterium TaxID=2030880 RepID=A0A972VZD8_9GAMM|nr:holo-ACP synthase [SAR86 cluster bacterium]